ncbi:hypothetical protein EGW08_012932 [Elysia chlorotica]|uniref:Phosphatidylinositol-glycan biosynthesis class X protein n=1 Tax=Elysia chlorotica TaxID=188477 RepID=A0A3S0ZHZ3_ELYCH|nr:hypothetical protein EGW08_012932 [Elysia chlorotica]
MGNEGLNLLAACLLLLPVISSGVLSKDHLVIERKLGGYGFHRDLETIIHLPNKLRKHMASSGCNLLVYQNLPSGVYADPFQVQSLKQFGLPEIVFDRNVDIEAAEYASKAHELFMFVELSTYRPHKITGHLNIEIVLPIHARYHAPSSDEASSEPRARISILHPGLYSNCSQPDMNNILRAPCSSTNSTYCDWVQVSYISYSPQVEMSIPVGEEKHKALVVSTSLAVTALIFAWLCRTIYTSKINLPHKES